MNKSAMYTVAIAAVVVVVLDMLRPKGARILNKGAKGENALLFDPASGKA